MTHPRYKLEAEYIEEMAGQLGDRTGQFLFSYLQHDIAQIVRGTPLDPYQQVMSFDEIVRWLEQHIDYDNNGNMIRLRNGDDILWEKV